MTGSKKDVALLASIFALALTLTLFSWDGSEFECESEEKTSEIPSMRASAAAGALRTASSTPWGILRSRGAAHRATLRKTCRKMGALTRHVYRTCTERGSG